MSHLSRLTEESAVEVLCLDWLEAHALLDPWRQLALADPRAPLVRFPEWITAACATGTLRSGQVLVVRDGAPLALAPLVRTGLWSVEVGAPFVPDDTALLLAPAREAAVWEALVRWMRGQRRIRLLGLGVSEDEGRPQQLARACANHGAVCLTQPAGARTHLALPADWESYLRGLGKSTRDNLRYAESVLRREYPDREILLHESPDAARPALEALMDLHRVRWQAQIGGSFFREARNAAFYRQVVAWALGQHSGVVGELRVGGRAIATAVVFHLPGQPCADLHCVARDVDALPRRHSPGIVLLAHLLRWAIARGVQDFRMGAGSAEYKQHLGGREQPLVRCWIARSALSARVVPRVNRALFLICRAPVHLAHHGRRLLAGAHERDKEMQPPR